MVPNDITSTTRLLLVNAVYLKAKWLFPFHESKLDNFYLKGRNEPIKAQMMKKKFLAKLANVPKLKARALELPYEGKQVKEF